MSAFSDALCMAAQGPTGMTTGEPHEPVRILWADVHAKACAGARVLAAHGIGPGDAVAVPSGRLAFISAALDGTGDDGAAGWLAAFADLCAAAAVRPRAPAEP